MNTALFNVVDRIRTLATLIIILFHCSCPYYAWQWDGYQGNKEMVKNIVDFVFLHLLDNTMLPVFFCLSGILFYCRKDSYSNLLSTLWKKFDRLMVPYALCFCLCAWLNLPLIGVSCADGHLWFIRELFIIFCVTLLLYHFPNWVPLLVGLCSFILNFVFIKLGIGLPEIVEHFMMYYFYFILGAVVPAFFEKIRGSLCRIAIIIIWLVTLILDLQSAYMIVFIFLLFSVVPKSNICSRFVAIINTQSYGIYLIHHVVIFFLFQLNSIVKVYETNAVIAILVMFSLTTSFSLAITLMLKKMGFKYF